MRIFDEKKKKELKDVDLEKGKLIPDKLLVKHVEYKKAIPEQFHYETIKEYENGGKDVKKVIDYKGSPEVLEHDEFEDILVYIPFTDEEKERRELVNLLNWFDEYDLQVKQYERCQRLNIQFDKDINELDKQAQTNAKRISELRNKLK